MKGGIEELGPPKAAYLLSEVGGAAEAARLRSQAAATLEQELPTILRWLAPGATVVDLGCGSGLLADALARARPDAAVYGVDADALAVAEAQRVFSGPSKLSFLQRGLAQGPGPQVPAADLAVLRLVLMHQGDPRLALEECRAWLKPGGRLMVLECDDRAVEMSPPQEWLLPLLQVMETVQASRGGSRRLGLELGRLLEGGGWDLKAYGRIRFSLESMGPAFAGVFLPVAHFYLTEAVKLGALDPRRARDWEQELQEAIQGGLDSAMVPLFYALATPM